MSDSVRQFLKIRVEHGVTEAVHPGLDLVELMIRQGMAAGGSLDPSELLQEPLLEMHGHSIEARVYCENPKAGFKPSPGRLHHVEWADVGEGGRIDTWVEVSMLDLAVFVSADAQDWNFGDTPLRPDDRKDHRSQ